MKSFTLLLSVILSVAAYAQEDLRNELNDEISVLYPKTTLKKRPAAKKVASRQDLDLEENSRSVIINNNVSGPNSDVVREQPSTIVEASPLDVSKGAEVRRNREQIEKSTEDKIVQQLEKDRLQAEQERAKRTEDIFNKESSKEVVAPVAPIAVQEVTPVVVPTQSVSSEVPKTQSAQPEGVTQFYVGAIGGIGDYSTANNVQGKVAGGLAFGMIFPEDFVVEASLLFSRYDITESRCDSFGCSNYMLPAEIRMDQTNLSVAAKYMFLNGRVRPLVGGVISYVNRKFENKYNYSVNYYGGGAYPYYPGNRPSSWAIDGGLLVGADVVLSRKFSIGADLKYMMNVSYERDEDPRQKYYSGVMYNGSQPIEELSYYIFSINANFRF